MLLRPDCITCILKASVSAIRELTADEHTIREVVRDILEIPSIRGLDWGRTSPEVFEIACGKITAGLGNPDPFKAVKDRQNRKGLELYPSLKKLVEEARDALYTAVNLAVIGNSLDVLWSDGSIDVEPIIWEKLQKPVSEECFLQLRDRLAESDLVVYVGDNSGEIVFDRLLIETMNKLFNTEIVFVVRNLPVLNDVTVAEARAVGMDDVVKVVANGIDGPVPGTIVSRCSPEVRDYVEQADIMISKGGGNFESLEEEKQLWDKMFFLLMCKCYPSHSYFKTKMYDPILSQCNRGTAH